MCYGGATLINVLRKKAGLFRATLGKVIYAIVGPRANVGYSAHFGECAMEELGYFWSRTTLVDVLLAGPMWATVGALWWMCCGRACVGPTFRECALKAQSVGYSGPLWCGLHMLWKG